MITKELFIETMNCLKEVDERSNKIAELMVNVSELTDVYHNIIINLLEGLFDDKGGWIGYYVYELDWGKLYHDGCIIDKEKGNIKLDTPSDLWDLLRDNQFEKSIKEVKELEELQKNSKLEKSAYEYDRGL